MKRTRRLASPSRRDSRDPDIHAPRNGVGNRQLLEQMGLAREQHSSQPSHLHPRSHNDDAALKPLRNALNDASLITAERAKLMLNYRDQQLARVGPLVPLQLKQAENSPLVADGPQRGLHNPLLERLGQSESMQTLMQGLISNIFEASKGESGIDVAQLFSDLQGQSRGLANEESNTPETNLESLRVMATLAHYYKVDSAHAESMLPAGLWGQVARAGTTLATQSNPEASVMSHGVPSGPDGENDFTADRNFHFFSHAYLAATLNQEHELSPPIAEAMSGFLGAQYELSGSNVKENLGNSGIKDILLNAEGARFGTSLMANGETPLPGMYDGPVPENRSIVPPHLRLFPSIDFPLQEILEEAQDLSPLNAVSHMARGGFLNFKDQFRPSDD